MLILHEVFELFNLYFQWLTAIILLEDFFVEDCVVLFANRFGLDQKVGKVWICLLIKEHVAAVILVGANCDIVTYTKLAKKDYEPVTLSVFLKCLDNI